MLYKNNMLEYTLDYSGIIRDYQGLSIILSIISYNIINYFLLITTE